jgi:hypothetical protein
MTLLRLSCLGSIAALLGACAVPSDYHATDLRGGFSEAQLDRTIFRVTYTGNVSQRQSETDELALLRGAEVAQAHGYAWFTSGGNAATGTGLALFSGTVSVPATTITIACYTTRPETSGLIYEADRVIATLGPKYRRL